MNFAIVRVNLEAEFSLFESLHENIALNNTLISALQRNQLSYSWTSAPQTPLDSVCYFKLLSVWQFIMQQNYYSTEDRKPKSNPFFFNVLRHNIL